MAMANPTLEEQIATAGLAYGRRHDISYRAGLVMQVLGAAVLAVLYPLESPFYTVGIMLFNAGALLSGDLSPRMDVVGQEDHPRAPSSSASPCRCSGSMDRPSSTR